MERSIYSDTAVSAGMEITSRHHLRSDDVRRLREAIADRFGVEFEGEQFEAIEFADRPFRLVLVDGIPMVLDGENGPMLTVRGANAVEPRRAVVTVDAGAVPFVSDGADVMRPGIVDADDGIATGDPVLIAEETHGKVLAIGRAQTAGPDMVGDHGKVIESIHHVGDELYNVST